MEESVDGIGKVNHGMKHEVNPEARLAAYPAEDHAKRSADETKVAEGLGEAQECDYRTMYEQTREAFDAYRRETEARLARDTKARLYEAMLRRAGVDERRIGAVMRVADVEGLAVREGRLEDEAEVLNGIRREWADFIPSEHVETPPRGGRSVTREGILAMRDPRERQRAICEHHELFGF